MRWQQSRRSLRLWRIRLLLCLPPLQRSQVCPFPSSVTPKSALHRLLFNRLVPLLVLRSPFCSSCLPVAAYPVPAPTLVQGGPRGQRQGARSSGCGQTSSPHPPDRGVCDPGGGGAFPCECSGESGPGNAVKVPNLKRIPQAAPLVLSAFGLFSEAGRRSPEGQRFCPGRPLGKWARA